MITRYRPRILAELKRLIGPLDVATVLDFGSGDGYFASHMAQWPGVAKITAVDVVERERGFLKPQLYDGRSLPFGERSFDLVYAVDVLHHCPRPLDAIFEMARCADRYLLIKDHSYASFIGRWTLAVLDELGNRRFGIPSPRHYQHRWEWVEQLETRGWHRLALRHPLACHSGVMGQLTNPLQWIGLWERPTDVLM